MLLKTTVTTTKNCPINGGHHIYVTHGDSEEWRYTWDHHKAVDTSGKILESSLGLLSPFCNGYGYFVHTPPEEYLKKDTAGFFIGSINMDGTINFVKRFDYKNFKDIEVCGGNLLLTIDSSRRGLKQNKSTFIISKNGGVLSIFKNLYYIVYRGDDRYQIQYIYNSSFVVDKFGNKLCDTIFTNTEKFYNGYSIVSTKFGTGLIDTNGHFSISPIYDHLVATGNNKYFLYRGQDMKRGFNTRRAFGIITAIGNIVTSPYFDFDYQGLNTQEVIKIKFADINAYMNYTGKVIWSHHENLTGTTLLDTLNIDYQHYTRYSAITQRKKYIRKDQVGTVSEIFVLTPGTFDYDPLPKEESITPTISQNLSNGLNIIANTEDTTIYSKSRVGFTSRIANNSNQTFYLDSYNTSILPIMQALTPTGEWKDIEYFSSGWCGNGRESEAIAPQTYYELKAPLFAGGVKTRLRIKLAYFLTKSNMVTDQKSSFTVYSNEFIGYINPGQLWRSQYNTPDKLSIFRR
jgi:hypothetical protein